MTMQPSVGMFSIILLALMLTACNEIEIPQSNIRPAQVWRADSTPISHTSRYSGEIVARYESDLSFRVGGKITRRNVNVGDYVKVGQELARLDNNDLELNVNSISANLLAAQGNLQSSQGGVRAAQAQLDSTRANLRSAQAELSNAQEEYNRTLKLFKQNFISKAALDTQTNRYRTAQANVNAAQAQIQSATANLSASQAQVGTAQAQVQSLQSQVNLAKNQSGYSLLNSNIAGVVTAVAIEVGQVVNAGMTAFRIAQTKEYEAQIRVGEEIIQQLQIGLPVNVKLWANETNLAGKIREIAPSADQNRTWLVKISLLDAPSDLKLGLTAEISLSAIRQTKGTWLPATALYQQEKKPAVWIVDDQKRVQLQAVNIIRYQEQGMIIDGIADGTEVIVAGVHTLYQGQAIQPIAYNGEATPDQFNNSKP